MGTLGPPGGVSGFARGFSYFYQLLILGYLKFIGKFEKFEFNNFTEFKNFF